MNPRLFAGVCMLLTISSHAAAIDTDRANVQSFIDSMVSEHDFDRDKLIDVLEQAELKQSILDAISRPAERTLTWGEYRKIFINRDRIRAGARFWRENEAMLTVISTDSGVPIEILVGIIGVETYFGRITGGHRVLDALATLAFHHPPREKFFRRELEQYLLLVREDGIDAEDPTGSYAGAMGRPQFMPSSFRAYAVDATGDGKRDIWNNWYDVAGSVANYFLEHGWRPGESVTTQATLGNGWTGPKPEPANTLKPGETLQGLSKRGVMFSSELPGESSVELLTFEGDDGAEYWVGFHNFFVITRYNRSTKYALAVHQLGQEIALEVRR